MMDKQLQGRVAIVTGASSGFGRGIAVRYARAGANVVIADLVEETAPGNFDERPDLSTAALIRETGGEALFVKCDVSRKDDMEAAISQAMVTFGQLDILVNNAGVWRGMTLFHESTEADFDACFNVIVKGTFHASRAALKIFVDQRSGVIVNIVSTAGLRVYPLQLAYNSAKHAQIGMTRSLALEYGPSGVRVNAICPTGMKTSMNRSAFETPAISEAVKRSRALGRWGEINEVSEVALFLASEAASFVHGSIIPVDGGELLGQPHRSPSQ